MSNDPQPTKQRTEAVNLRVDKRFKAQLVAAAEKEKRSVSNYVIKVLSDKLDQVEAYNE